MAYEEAVVIGSAALTYIFFWLSTKIDETNVEKERKFRVFQYLSIVFFFVGLSFAINTVGLMHTVSAASATSETNSTIGTELVILTWTQYITYALFVIQFIVMILTYLDLRSEMRWRGPK